MDALMVRLEVAKRAVPLGCSEPEVKLLREDAFGRHILAT